MTAFHAERTRQLAARRWADEFITSVLDEDRSEPPLGGSAPKRGKRKTNEYEYEVCDLISINAQKVTWPHGAPREFEHEITGFTPLGTPISKQRDRIQKAYREIAAICTARNLVAFCRVTEQDFRASTLPDIRFIKTQLSLMHRPNPGAFDVLIIPNGMTGFGRREKDRHIHTGFGCRIFSPPSDAYANELDEE
jgi:hypothetical protein